MALTVNELGIVGDAANGTGLAARMNITAPTAAQIALLESFIKASSRMIENHLGRVLSYNAAIVEKCKSFGTTELTLARPPLWSIASIVDRDGQTIDATDYEINDDDAKYGGYVTRENGWFWTTLSRGPGAAYDALPGTERSELTVTYAGGYVTPNQNAVGGVDSLPNEIEEGCYMTAAYLLSMAGSDPRVQSERLMSYSATYGAFKDAIGQSGLPLVVEAMIGAHRIIVQR
jgi:hypothetical protein